MPLAAIWISDLIAAMGTLEPANESTLDAIAGLLGLVRAPAPAPPPAHEPSHPRQTTPTANGADSDSGPAPSASGRLPFTVQELPAIVPQETSQHARVSADPLKLQASVPGAPPKPVPLLSPLAGRFITQELVASSRFGPDPDLDRLVAALARCEIPQPVPLQERRTLALGVQVLVDDGEGMEPFVGDQQGMVDLVRRLAGEALVDVRRIYEVPDPGDPIHPWEPPPPGMPVLALTDLGLAGRVARGAVELAAAWQVIAAILATRGSSLIALVPYQAARWPASLSICMRLVSWDRSTTAARARQARSEGPGT
jgi:hypothetical protein